MKKMSANKKQTFLLGALLSVFVASILSICLLQSNSVSVNADESTDASCFKNVSVSLTEDIVLKYYVELPDGADNTATLTYRENDYIITGEESDNGQYVFAFNEVTPEFLGETVTANVAGEEFDYSVKAYCDKVLSYDDAYWQSNHNYSQAKIDALKGLVVDLLNYGAAAQTFTGQTANGLVNDGVDQSLATEYSTPTNVAKFIGVAQDVTFETVGLNCGSQLSVYYKVAGADASALTLKINEETVLTPVEVVGGVATFRYRNITPLQFGNEISAQVYNGETAVSNVLVYSVNSYVARTVASEKATEDMKDLAKTIANYGVAAEKFVNALSYELTTAPTETETGTLTVWQNGVQDTVELPVLNTDNYDYTNTDFSGNQGLGTFETKENVIGDYDFGRKLSFVINIDHFMDVGGTKYSIYDINKVLADGGFKGARIDGVPTVVLEKDVSLEQAIGFAGGDIAIAGEGKTLTLSNKIDLWDHLIIDEGVTVTVATQTNAFHLNAGSSLTIDGTVNTSGEQSENYQSLIITASAGVNVTVNGTLTSTGRGIPVYFAQNNANFVVNEGATVDLTAHGGQHAFVGNGQNNLLQINGGAVSFASKDGGDNNAILCQNAGLTVEMNGGTLTTTGKINGTNLFKISGGTVQTAGDINIETLKMSGGKMTLGSETQDDNKTTFYTNVINKIAMTGTATQDGTDTTAGTLNVYNTLQTKNLVVKDGNLNVTVNFSGGNERDGNGVWPHAIRILAATDGKAYRTYLLGGSVTVNNVGTSSLNGGFGIRDYWYWDWDNGFYYGEWILVVGGDFAASVSNAVFEAHRDGNASLYLYRYNDFALSNKYGDIDGTPYWDTINSVDHWKAVGVDCGTSVDNTLRNVELSVANKCGDVDFDALAA